MGVWFHLGWSHGGDLTTAYKDGCPLLTRTWQNMGQNWNTYPLYYGWDNIQEFAEAYFDESYLWEEEKPEVVFTLLYYGSGIY